MEIPWETYIYPFSFNRKEMGKYLNLYRLFPRSSGQGSRATIDT